MDYLFLYLFISVDTVESVCDYDITNIKHSHGTNTCMAQLPGTCENVLTRPSCLDGSSSGVESEINKRSEKISDESCLSLYFTLLQLMVKNQRMNCKGVPDPILKQITLKYIKTQNRKKEKKHQNR